MTLNPKGFWRVDKDKAPELRHTVLTLVAFHDLEEKIRACGGDREKGIEAFLNQNDGEGWMLPETLRLADYGLGHDERAREHQPVASRLGPRFYDWQLAQSAEESWRECHLHARNLLGKHGYLDLLAEVLRDASVDTWRGALAPACAFSDKTDLLRIFLQTFTLATVDAWRNRLDAVREILAERGFSLEPADLNGLLRRVLKRIPEALAGVQNLLADADYRKLLADIEAEKRGEKPGHVAEAPAPYSPEPTLQGNLFE